MGRITNAPVHRCCHARETRLPGGTGSSVHNRSAERCGLAVRAWLAVPRYKNPRPAVFARSSWCAAWGQPVTIMTPASHASWIGGRSLRGVPSVPGRENRPGRRPPESSTRHMLSTSVGSQSGASVQIYVDCKKVSTHYEMELYKKCPFMAIGRPVVTVRLGALELEKTGKW